jgi:hypothetical protein
LLVNPNFGSVCSSQTTLAFKWIRILFRCSKDRAAYDENKYLAALAKRGSPLGKLAVVGMPACEIPEDPE